MVNKITSIEQYNNILSNNKNVVIDCYADWCGPCKMVAPILESISNKLNDISFNKINVDELNVINNINAIPCIVLFKNGKEAIRIIGYRDEETLEKEIKKVFA